MITILPFRYKNRPVMTGPGLYDPTTVLSTDNLSKNMREGWIKLAIYLISFFYYIYGYVLFYVFNLNLIKFSLKLLAWCTRSYRRKKNGGL